MFSSFPYLCLCFIWRHAYSAPNVVFLIADDLRPELSIYGHSHVVTPNFANLADQSVVFDRVYNQVPVCFPSRHSLLTGLRPDTLRIHTWTDSQQPYVDSLFSMLVRRKYLSAGVGKLFHHPHNGSSEFPDGRWDGGWSKYQNIEDEFMNSTVTPDSVWNEDKFRDHIITTHAIEKLESLNEKSQRLGVPFLLSVGFKLPHTQYHIPRHFFDLYNNSAFINQISSMDVSQDNVSMFPIGAPRMNYRCCAKGMFRPMVDQGRTKSTDTKHKLYGLMRIPGAIRAELMRGYLGGISFLDAQVIARCDSKSPNDDMLVLDPLNDDVFPWCRDFPSLPIP